MKVKLAGPALGLCLGLGIAIGCGGSSTSDVTGSQTDSGTDSASTIPDSSVPDSGTSGDAGDAGGDGAVPGTEVSVQYGSCSTFTPCGGDPSGTWTYAAGGCLDAIDLSSCPSATITNPDIKVKGQVSFSGATSGTVTRHAQVDISATVGVPQSCVNLIPDPFPKTCSSMESALKLPPLSFDAATCTNKAGAGSGCDCDISKTQVDNGSESFSVSGNTITTGTGNSSRTYDFCVNPATTFTYQETTAGAPQKATLVMTK